MGRGRRTHCSVCGRRLNKSNATLRKGGTSFAGTCKTCAAELKYVERWRSKTRGEIHSQIALLERRVEILRNILAEGGVTWVR